MRFYDILTRFWCKTLLSHFLFLYFFPVPASFIFFFTSGHTICIIYTPGWILCWKGTRYPTRTNLSMWYPERSKRVCIRIWTGPARKKPGSDPMVSDFRGNSVFVSGSANLLSPTVRSNFYYLICVRHLKDRDLFSVRAHHVISYHLFDISTMAFNSLLPQHVAEKCLICKSLWWLQNLNFRQPGPSSAFKPLGEGTYIRWYTLTHDWLKLPPAWTLLSFSTGRGEGTYIRWYTLTHDWPKLPPAWTLLSFSTGRGEGTYIRWTNLTH